MAEIPKDSCDIAVYQSLSQIRAHVAAAHIMAQVKFAHQAIRGAFALNAIVGIGIVTKTRELTINAGLCGAGALCAVLTAACAWIVQQAMRDMDVEWLNYQIGKCRGNPLSTKVVELRSKRAVRLVMAASCLYCASIFLFAYSMYKTFF